MDLPPPPYVLEDSTGALAGTDFDDIYDRLFLRVAQSPQYQPHPQRKSIVTIHNMGHRSPPRARDLRHFNQAPVVILEFERDASLGSIRFGNRTLSIPMSRKIAIFGGSEVQMAASTDGVSEVYQGRNGRASHQKTTL